MSNLSDFINGRYCLYVHTAPNGKKYVGITSRPVKERWKNGIGYKGSYFSRAIKKYGWENFKHEILFSDLSKDEAIKLEKEYIEKFETTNRDKGYNLSLGGEVPPNKMADDANRKLHLSLMAHRQWKNGKVKSGNKVAPKMLNSVSKYRKKVFQYGSNGELITVFDSIKDAANKLGVNAMSISEACNKSNLGRKCKGFTLKFEKDEYKSNGVRGSWSARPVIQFDINYNMIAEYKSASEAARSFGKKTPCTILDACKGKQITAYGYRWRFANE